MAAREPFESALQLVSLRLSLSRRAVVDRRELRSKQVSALRAEDPVRLGDA
ncbi:hypothetical protein [Streptomyces umbrinus]|uniref:hypothetical protein n=1 Tax=Streptomyces umbrinus TaxID=67370 RepID=UPI0027D8F8E2|nr:hypothetical protein [Streptomyces umbrinus]